MVEDSSDVKKLLREVRRVENSAALQRQLFAQKAMLYLKLNRVLTLVAALAALTAAVSLAISLAEWLEESFVPLALHIVAISTAALSALLSAILATSLSSGRIRRTISAAMRYLELREAAKRVRLRPPPDVATLREEHASLQEGYTKAAQEFGEIGFYSSHKLIAELASEERSLDAIGEDAERVEDSTS